MLRPLLALILLAAPLGAQSRPVVVIDPGHGGTEIGVEAAGLLEKDLILRISMSIGAEFVAAGYDVVYTRTRDGEVAWDDRRGTAEEAGAIALLMMHAMQSDNPAADGAEIYFHEGDANSSALARAVDAQLRGLGSDVLLDPRPWPFLQSASVPTAMIELAHMTNAADRARLLDATWHHEVGRALVRAVEATR